jgi:4-hydroxy-tetrahydrodipicolinate synthase
MPNAPFARVIAAIATPFCTDLAIDVERMIAHATWLFDHGCDGLVLFGTTGEAASLTLDERKRTFDVLIASGIAANRIVVGTGCCAIADTVELTRHAGAAGAAGALVLPPYFYKGVSNEGIVRTFDYIVAGCGPSLPPLYLYHIPQLAGAGFSPELVGKLIDTHGARIRGYKDSSGNWDNTQTILSRFPALEVYVGSEALLLETLRAGGAGCISGSVNVQPAPVRDVLDNFQSANADTLQAAASAVRTALEKAGPFVAVIKAVLCRIHHYDGWAVTRPPLDALRNAPAESLLSELRARGLTGV